MKSFFALGVLAVLSSVLCSEALSGEIGSIGAFRGGESIFREQPAFLPATTSNRRNFLAHFTAFSFGVSSPAYADLTSELFNPDGSLKEGVESEAKFRIVDFIWDPSDREEVNIDGKNVGSTQNGSRIMLSYRLPEKWASGTGQDELYYDRSEGVNAKACTRITVYQAPGTASFERLEKATTLGVANALDVPADLKKLASADLIGGRKARKEDQTYYEFDMAVAPETCGSSKENLGLGFCPYDSIYLLASTIIDSRLYVMVIESDKSEWKRANSDLKVVRSSFSVQEAEA